MPGYQQPPPPPMGSQRGPPPPYVSQQIGAPYPAETGYCDLDQVTSPAWRKEAGDWVVVYNPRSPSLNRARLNVDLIHNLEHSRFLFIIHYFSNLPLLIFFFSFLLCKSVVCCVKFSLDGTLLATGCNRVAQVFDVRTGRLVSTLQADSLTSTEASTDLYIRSVIFSPNSQLLATGAEDRVIRIWAIRTRSLVHVLRGHDQDIYSLDWSRDGSVLVSGSGDRSCRIWDAESGQCVMVLVNDEERGPSAPMREAGVTSVAINPIDGKCVATVSTQKSRAF